MRWGRGGGGADSIKASRHVPGCDAAGPSDVHCVLDKPRCQDKQKTRVASATASDVAGGPCTGPPGSATTPTSGADWPIPMTVVHLLGGFLTLQANQPCKRRRPTIYLRKRLA